MGPLRIALSFLRVPQLFVYLLLFPLLIGLFLVVAQLLITGFVLTSLKRTPHHIEERQQLFNSTSLARRLLLGDNLPSEPLICLWRGTNGKERPPSAECAPSKLDVALKSRRPHTIDPTPYLPLFAGQVARLHLCSSCTPDITIDLDTVPPTSTVRSVWGGLIWNLSMVNASFRDRAMLVAKDTEQRDGLLGTLVLSLPGLTRSTQLTGSRNLFALVFNIATLVLVSLWLALKAHRKVLNYFASNGALLPMVAATGRGNFYTALWLLTVFRVCAFLVASIPAIGITLRALFRDDGFNLAAVIAPRAFCLWLVAISASFALATIFASVADLKHRHLLFSFSYRFAPLILSLFGSVVWGASFLFESNAAILVQQVIASIPIVGMAPVLLFPIFQIVEVTLLIHAGLATIGLIVVMRLNARWFAAHLEEL